MNHNDNFDRILDQALSEYRDAEPLAGMKDRILHHIAAQPAKSSRWIRWTFGWSIPASFAGLGVLAVIAAVVIVALLLGFRDRPRPSTRAVNVTPGAPFKPSVGLSETQHTSPASTDSKPETGNSKLAQTPGAPFKPSVGLSGMQRTSPAATSSKLETRNSKLASAQFPAPAPLTSEEHALIALARTHPGALLGQPDADQLSIDPIEIKPLAPETGAPQGEQP